MLCLCYHQLLPVMQYYEDKKENLKIEMLVATTMTVMNIVVTVPSVGWRSTSNNWYLHI